MITSINEFKKYMESGEYTGNAYNNPPENYRGPLYGVNDPILINLADLCNMYYEEGFTMANFVQAIEEFNSRWSTNLVIPREDQMENLDLRLEWFDEDITDNPNEIEHFWNKSFES